MSATKKQKQREEQELATLFKSPNLCIMELTVTFGQDEISAYFIHEHEDDDPESIEYDHDAIIEDVTQMLASKLRGLPEYHLTLLEEGPDDFYSQGHLDLDDFIVHVVEDPDFIL
ncbi:YALI0C09845p [Yarrowia lipolytica CLIB122]|jgi:hypothetical protein|uniref:YALI0C09845p n=3 Tax=Yarrowia lipolytica TaxID=4952 RepID=Q6CCF4_YARLI|nr:YALI0C09845p [Yarrowia lipolytica CLIB122]AOW02606.1 hypothetical protein YALI1_C13726g [Yarrowia lipolytica]KAJ8053277.1 hypothetical protein LXG23DRAFT_54873 [Yarrowia lipolytica]QNP97349.1 Hypothetical protein YALI2_C01002g [Yarrowia lipolytica]CAG81965.1 YALI0C09845p [Yarrowia lipolytica CLIB122]SEI31310.1 YALIA101S01e20032g1_1 [Yarrowia lipolytica]|eukprot:XP_501658.1 YALI0C09845p [Yarrowia lipolytica CLIB122]